MVRGALQKTQDRITFDADAQFESHALVISALAGIGLYEAVADEFSDRPASRTAVDRFFEQRFGRSAKRVTQLAQGTLFGSDLFLLIEFR